MFAPPEVLRGQNVPDADALVRSGRLSEARTAYEGLLKQNERDAVVHYKLGMLLLARVFEEGEDEAVAHMERAVDLDKQNADYYYGLGAAYGVKAQRSGMIKQAFLAPKAKKAFLRAIELNNQHIPARIGLIQYYLMAPGIMGGDEELAARHIDTLVLQDEVVGRTFRARMLEREKKVTEAEKELKTALDHHPQSERAWRSLGSFYLRTGKPDDALRSFQSYAALRPDTADVYDAIGEAYLKKGDSRSALAQFEKALALDPAFGPSLLKMGDAYRMQREPVRARECYAKLLAVDGNERRRREAEERLKELE